MQLFQYDFSQQQAPVVVAQPVAPAPAPVQDKQKASEPERIAEYRREISALLNEAVTMKMVYGDMAGAAILNERAKALKQALKAKGYEA